MMKQLTKLPKIEDYYFIRLQNDLGVSIPTFFINFMKLYADNEVLENSFIDEYSKTLFVKKFCDGNTMKRYSKGINARGLGLQIPFGLDEKERFYCLCLDSENYGAIYLFTLTGTWNNINGELKKVSDSFHTFINNLQIQDKNPFFLPDNSGNLKNLTLVPELTEKNILYIEDKIKTIIPNYYKDFMKEYANNSISESSFYDKNGKMFELARFCNFTLIDNFISEFVEDGLGLKLPIAIDSGGWPFCLTLDTNGYGQIVMYQMESGFEAKEKAFVFIANSFEQFINGLITQEEADKLRD